MCNTDSFQAGFPNRSVCVFCTFLRYFLRVPTHMQPKSESCSSPFACSSRLALDLCTAVLPSTASLPRFGWNQTLTEHCRTRQASSERQLRMSGCLLCLFGRMCSFSVKNRLQREAFALLLALMPHKQACYPSLISHTAWFRGIHCGSTGFAPGYNGSA